MQEKSSIKDKILFYLDFKGITKYKFYKDTGITRGILDQKNGITEDNLLKFLKYAQDISLEWLLFGKGELLKEGKGEVVQSPVKAKYIDAPYQKLYEKQKIEIKELNREIGKLQLTIEQLKKGDQAASWGLAAEPKLEYKPKSSTKGV